MRKKILPGLALLVISVLSLSCGSDSSALPFCALEQNSTVYDAAGLLAADLSGSGVVSGQIPANFSYSDTLYLSNYRVAGIPGPEEARNAGMYLGKSEGDEPVRYYYLPPMCGDFVLIDENGHAGQYRTNSACD